MCENVQMIGEKVTKWRKDTLKKTFCGSPWVVTSTGPGGFRICLSFLWREHTKAHWKWFYGEAGNWAYLSCFKVCKCKALIYVQFYHTIVRTMYSILHNFITS